MKNIRLIIALLLISSAFSSCTLGKKSRAQNSDINILEYGAIPDGTTDNTAIIQKVIDHCAEDGGGTIFFPAGTYMSGTIFLKDNITLKLNRLAVLKGIADVDLYPGKHFSEKGFVRIDGVSNVTITGQGTIDGSGDQEVFQQGNDGDNRPYLVHVRQSKHVVIEDVNLQNSAFWTLRLFENDGVRIDDITLYSHNNWNNDGIDIDSKNVIVANCRIDCDDDGICFKSDGTQFCENVTVTNCIIGSNCNPIKFGTSSYTGFRNIAVSNCVIQPASESKFRKWNEIIDGVTDSITGISGIALEIVDGGQMEQITINNISMKGVQTPVFIRLGSRRNPTGSIRNVLISNVVASSRSLLPSSITAVPGFYVENVTIRDLVVNCMGGGTVADYTREVPESEKAYPENRMMGNTLPAYGLYVRHARNILVDNLQFYLDADDERPAVYFEDAKEIVLCAFKADLPSGKLPLIEKRRSEVKEVE